MKKILLYPISFTLLIILILLIFLSTIGYETDKFNSTLEQQINNYNSRISANLKTIKIKANLRHFNFFITTANPNITLYDNKINIEKIDAYLNLKSLLKMSPNITKIHISTGEININNFKNLVKYAKPSNYKKFILNNLNSGNIKVKIDLNLDQKNNLKNYEFNGIARDVNFFFNKFNFKKTNFIFFLTRNQGELNNISSSINGFQINTGTIKYLKNNNYKLNGEIESNFKINKTLVDTYFKNNFFDQVKSFNAEGTLKNVFDLNFDNTLKIKDFSISSSGEIDKSLFNLSKAIKSPLLKQKIDNIAVKKSNFKIDLKSNEKNSFISNGIYSLNNKEYQNYKISTLLGNKSKDIEFDIDISQKIEIQYLNYNSENRVSNISSRLNVSKNKIKIENLNFKENKSFIKITNLVLKNNKLFNLNKISVKTFKENKLKNDFSINFGKQIEIKGSIFDATNLVKAFDGGNKNKLLNNLSKEINITLKKVTTNFPDDLSNFNLIGNINKGEFTKISSKGEFPNEKYLDISIKKDKEKNKNKLEIYSDIPEPLLSNYKFFQGLSGGKLSFNSEYDSEKSFSNLVIENFKVKNAPGFVKLLSLADLGGMVDALSGEGLSFITLEMVFEKDEKVLNLKELYAIGPSLSVLMEGYIENKTGLVSLRGTMVPAKTLNKLLSKIPVVGSIIIPKEVGEGVFGVSFKMKGLPGKIKTSVNPIKTLTPRFIQKALKKPK